jgi:hypothetical protein
LRSVTVRAIVRSPRWEIAVFKVRVVHVPPSLVRGRVRRLVETHEGILLVQVWSAQGWQAEPGDRVSPLEVRRGIDAPPGILRALGVPEVDWPPFPSSGHGSVTVTALALWPLLEWLTSPVTLGLLTTA